MRKRMIDPEFWLDEEIAKLSPHARLLYIGLWNLCDDNHATLPNKPDWIKVQIFPYEFIEIKTFIKELADINKIVLFKENNQEYWYIKNFFKHQTVNHPSKPKYPKFPRKTATLQEDYSSTPPQYNIIQSNIIKDNISKSKRNLDFSFNKLLKEKKEKLIKNKAMPR